MYQPKFQGMPTHHQDYPWYEHGRPASSRKPRQLVANGRDDREFHTEATLQYKGLQSPPAKSAKQRELPMNSGQFTATTTHASDYPGYQGRVASPRQPAVYRPKADTRDFSTEHSHTYKGESNPKSREIRAPAPRYVSQPFSGSTEHADAYPGRVGRPASARRPDVFVAQARDSRVFDTEHAAQYDVKAVARTREIRPPATRPNPQPFVGVPSHHLDYPAWQVRASSPRPPAVYSAQPDDRHFYTEAAHQYTDKKGSPAKSAKMREVPLGNRPFYGETTHATSYQGERGRVASPRQPQQYVPKPEDRHFSTEHGGQYTGKRGAPVQRKIQVASRGIPVPFVGISEAAQQYGGHPGRPASARRPDTFVAHPRDSRQWNTEHTDFYHTKHHRQRKSAW